MIADRKAGSSRLKYWFEPGVSLSILSFSSAPSSGLLLFAGLVVASLDIALQWKHPPPLSTSCRPPLSRQQPPSLTLLFRESRRITSMVKPTKPKYCTLLTPPNLLIQFYDQYSLALPPHQLYFGATGLVNRCGKI
mmetsp:Transcript_1295/g.2737  ORF Transcript_1295/g.2737 Transcript_1295/m.2737 type:complete len:136 (-) Transcript_1295:165-572(-)